MGNFVYVKKPGVQVLFSDPVGGGVLSEFASRNSSYRFPFTPFSDIGVLRGEYDQVPQFPKPEICTTFGSYART